MLLIEKSGDKNKARSEEAELWIRRWLQIWIMSLNAARDSDDQHSEDDGGGRSCETRSNQVENTLQHGAWNMMLNRCICEMQKQEHDMSQ